MISKERLTGNWQTLVGSVKEKFGQITGDELNQVRGNVEQLIGLIQTKTGQSREQIATFLDQCCESSERNFSRISESAGAYATAAGDAIHQNYEQLSEGAARGYDSAVTAVSKKPLESLAIALGAGLFAGLLVGLSMTSRKR